MDAERLLFFKPENLQLTGSFKIRGAYNKIASLSEEEKKRGVIAFSSGNHAQGVAYAARALGMIATIMIPASAPKIKQLKTEALGGKVILLDYDMEKEWRARPEELALEYGRVLIHPFNDEMVIAGQATVGMEILEDLPSVETVIVPVGGGGLLSGIGAAIKLTNPNIHVIGVEPILAADAQASFQSGHIVELSLDQTRHTIADGLRTTRLGEKSFAHLRAFADYIITVGDDEIFEATRRLLLDVHLVAEPSGAATFAAFLFHQKELPFTRQNVAVISGGNVDQQMLAQAMTKD